MAKLLWGAVFAIVSMIAAGVGVRQLHKKSRPPVVVEVGGVSLGMSMEAYRAIASAAPGFQVAGVGGPTVGVPQATFRDNRLERFRWNFATEKYEVVRRELSTRYPQIECERVRGNAIVHIEHERCVVGRTLLLREGERRGAQSVLLLQDEAESRLQ